MKRDPHSVLVQPLLTEKLTAMRESGNKVGFVVRGDANRIQIKRAVESVLKVEVERVNVMNVPRQDETAWAICRKATDWKKAIVTLKEGEKLEMFEGA